MRYFVSRFPKAGIFSIERICCFFFFIFCTFAGGRKLSRNHCAFELVVTRNISINSKFTKISRKEIISEKITTISGPISSPISNFSIKSSPQGNVIFLSLYWLTIISYYKNSIWIINILK